MFKKMKLRQRILLGYLAPLLLLLGAMGLVFVNLQKTNQLTAARDHSQQVQFLAQQTMLDLVTLQRSTRGYILYRNPVSLQSIQDNLGELNSNLERLKAQVTDAQQQEVMRSFDQAAKDLVAILQTEVELVDAGKPEEAVKMLRSKGLNESRALEDSWKRFKQREDEIVKMLNRSEEDSMSMVMNSIIYGMLGAIALSVVIALWLTGTISRSITTNASHLSTATNEIATTITELSASSRQSSEQAANTAAAAEKSSAATVQGGETTRQTVAAMEKLKDSIATMADQILHLGEQTEQIGSIATLVKDLAAQINMLALNAAVEAARAGEHGKGFAVVASEVRKLADQSKTSAETATALVADIQKATNSSIMMTEESSHTVAEVMQLAQKVAELFSTLSSMANTVNENSQQVMLNAQQQSAAFGQVVEATNSIAAGARENLEGIA
jgi:CHASE3 domain sensor protein